MPTPFPLLPTQLPLADLPPSISHAKQVLLQIKAGVTNFIPLLYGPGFSDRVDRLLGVLGAGLMGMELQLASACLTPLPAFCSFRGSPSASPGRCLQVGKKHFSFPHRLRGARRESQSLSEHHFVLGWFMQEDVNGGFPASPGKRRDTCSSLR